jgi:hypothetical protein
MKLVMSYVAVMTDGFPIMDVAFNYSSKEDFLRDFEKAARQAYDNFDDNKIRTHSFIFENHFCPVLDFVYADDDGTIIFKPPFTLFELEEWFEWNTQD